MRRARGAAISSFHTRRGARTPVELPRALVVLRSGQGHHGLAIRKRQHARLLPLQQLLDHHLAPRVPKGAAQHALGGLHRLLHARRHHHALARAQAGGLHHHAVRAGAQVGLRLVRAREGAVRGGGDAVPGHKVLGPGLGRLQARRGGGGAKAGHPRGNERVRKAVRQRRLGANHHHARARGEAHRGGHVRVGGGCDAGERRAAAVAGRNHNGGGGAAQRPGERVLATAAANDHNRGGGGHGVVAG